MTIPGVFFAVTILVLLHNDQELGKATGFFYQEGERKFLVTCRHVFTDMFGNGTLPQQGKNVYSFEQNRSGQDKGY